MKTVCEFNVKHFREVIGAVLKAGYRPTFFEMFRGAAYECMIRHDIEIEPILALNLARIEYEMNVHATYFFQFSTEFYNVKSTNSRKIVKEISKLGHGIGLHVDETFYSDLLELDIELRHIIDHFQYFFDVSISVISFHRPSNKVLNNDQSFGGCIHTYQPKFFGNISYISDSYGRWSHGNFFDRLASLSGDPFQLLIHPYLWSFNGDMEVEAIIERILNKKIENIRQELRRNFKLYHIE